MVSPAQTRRSIQHRKANAPLDKQEEVLSSLVYQEEMECLTVVNLTTI